jgi:hypothetical protein
MQVIDEGILGGSTQRVRVTALQPEGTGPSARDGPRPAAKQRSACDRRRNTRVEAINERIVTVQHRQVTVNGCL